MTKAEKQKHQKALKDAQSLRNDLVKRQRSRMKVTVEVLDRVKNLEAKIREIPD